MEAAHACSARYGGTPLDWLNTPTSLLQASFDQLPQLAATQTLTLIEAALAGRGQISPDRMRALERCASGGLLSSESTKPTPSGAALRWVANKGAA